MAKHKVADWPEKLISYNAEPTATASGEVADWPEKLISYNKFYSLKNLLSVADWPEKLISYNNLLPFPLTPYSCRLTGKINQL